MSRPIAKFDSWGRMEGQTKEVYFASVRLRDVPDLVKLQKQPDWAVTFAYVICQIGKQIQGNRLHGFVSRERNGGKLIGYHGVRRVGERLEVWSVPQAAATDDLNQFVKEALASDPDC